MKQKLIIHNIVVGASLIAFGASLWWAVRRLAPVAARSGPIATLASPVTQATPSEVTNTASRPDPHDASQQSAEPAERRALRADAVSRQQELARSQDTALTGLSESQRLDALRSFAASQREAIGASVAAQDRLLGTAETPATATARPEVVAAQARFAAVRRAVIDDGVSLEEAEAHSQVASPGPSVSD